MDKLVVLSTPLQYSRFLQEGFKPGEFEIWCDDERHYGFFERSKIPFRKLDEDLIAEHWEKINTWSCETASRWIGFCREHDIFDEVDWAAAVCIVHGYLLAPILRSYHFSKFLIRQRLFRQVIIFSGHAAKSFPQFSGNFYLNRFLALECQSRGLPARSIDLQEMSAGKNWQPETRSVLRSKILPKLKIMINNVYAFFVKPGNSFDVLAFGSLRHLRSTIEALHQKGIQIALYDFEFHAEQFSFALKQGIPYLLPECFPRKTFLDPGAYAVQAAGQFEKALRHCAENDLFVYEGVNLREIIQQDLFHSMQSYFLQSAERINHYKNISTVSRIRSVLTEDDFSVKGGVFAAYFRSIQVPVYCLSHANFAVNVQVAEQNCHFDQSYTFVHSEFEKSNYVRRGWKPDRLVVTGTPRYDRLIGMAEAHQRKTNRKTLRLLFCGTGLWSFSPDVYSYVGHQKECFGQVQIPVLQAVFRAIQNQPVELVIKPHSFEMIPLWKKLIQESPVLNQIVLTKHSDDIFQLLLDSDAMILAYWSTTIIESALAGTPTLYVDFKTVKSPLLYDYSSKGFCHMVHSEPSLHEAIQKIVNGERTFFKTSVPEDIKRHYLGLRDAGASRRAADFLEKMLL